MSTAKKAIATAVGAGTAALTKARELPQRVITLSSPLKPNVVIDLRQIPKQIQSLGASVPLLATELVDEAKKISDLATTRLTKAYVDLAKLAQGTVIKPKAAKPKAAKPKAAKPKAAKPKAASAPKAAVKPKAASKPKPVANSSVETASTQEAAPVVPVVTEVAPAE
ncbi:MAG: hypothetical protein WDA27_04620 [Actinomycetota bacterium]